MLAERQQRALPVFDQAGGVGRRVALRVDRDPFRQRLARLVRHPRLAERDGRGGHVEQHRLMPGAGHGHSERVGAEARCRRPPDRLHLHAAGDIGEGDECQAPSRALLAIRAHPPDMPGVAHREQAHPDLDRPGARTIDRQRRHALPHAALGVEHEDRTRVDNRAEFLVEDDPLFLMQAHVGGQHANPMTVMPGQVGGHQMRSHRLRLGRGAAHGEKHVAGEGVERLWGEGGHGGLSMCLQGCLTLGGETVGRLLWSQGLPRI